MTEEDIIKNEFEHSGTSWTRNEAFDKNGFLVLQNLYDPQELFHPVPEIRGQLNYRSNKLDDFEHIEEEDQVEGSLARYWHPQYRKIHSDIRLIIEKEIGRKLYNTYYYDRFYFPGQELKKHTDRAACEISISVHVSTNIKGYWPFFIKTPYIFADSQECTKVKKLINTGDIMAVSLNPGDGVLYKGCERPHWRDKMPGTLEMMGEGEQLYYHQIFFHYVLQDGIRAHHAWDKCN